MSGGGRPRGYIENYNPQERTKQLLGDARSVLEEYRKHWPLTCRQIFYRLIGAFGYEKTENFYSTLCHHIANARRGRALSFDAIRDDGVTTYTFDHYADADGFRAEVRHKANSYRRDLMADQSHYIEVWCEAAGMLQQLARVTERYSIRCYSSSGFDSLTAKKQLADRICDVGRPAIILHLGDFDPSGESMFRVIEEDVGAFVSANRPHGDCRVEFHRVALTAGQVAESKLPTAPAKATDSRSKSWKGETCQLEALAPDEISNLLEETIVEIVDVDLMKENLEIEAQERTELLYLLPSPDSTASRNSDGDVS